MSCKTIYVMISSFLSEEEKMIVAAHELGHIILHRSQLKMAPMQDDTLYNMDYADITDENYDEIVQRMDTYMDEFEVSGVDHLVLEEE